MGSNPIIGTLESVILRWKIDSPHQICSCAGSRTKKHENAVYLPSIRQVNRLYALAETLQMPLELFSVAATLALRIHFSRFHDSCWGPSACQNSKVKDLISLRLIRPQR
jgi:hypothetical protein